MKQNFLHFLKPPLHFFGIIWITTIAFNLISAPSDIKVAGGIIILIILFAMLYKYISHLLK